MLSEVSSGSIRRCRPDEVGAMLAIINAAAEAYRGAIPADCWREPYMSMIDLKHEISDGVSFFGSEFESRLVGVMGVQSKEDVELIRHAYVLPERQRAGVGAALISHLKAKAGGRMLVGTWAAATWAISFYERQGFDLVSAAMTPILLERYWTISARQAEVSVVLAAPATATL